MTPEELKALNIPLTPLGMTTVAGAATILGVSRSMLNNMAARGGGPARVKMGKRVFYKVSDLEDWVLNQGEAA